MQSQGERQAHLRTTMQSYNSINLDPSKEKKNSSQTSDTNVFLGSEDRELTPEQILTTRLEEAGLETKRFCQIHEQKRSFTHHQALYDPDDLPAGNYGVKGVGDLVIIDVDDWDSAPAELTELINGTPTFTVQSPHADGKDGHYYYRCDDSVPDKSPDGVDIQSDGSLVVGPGSELESCDKSWHDCGLPGHGQYVIREDRPIASVERAEIPISDGEGNAEGEVSSPQQNTPQYELPEYNGELADVGDAILRDLKSDNHVSHYQLRKLLEGGVGGYADQLIKTENGADRIDRSRQENLALMFLYGSIRQVGKVDDIDRAERILYATFDYHMQENPETTDGQRRKWVDRGDDYKAPAVGSVIRDFDPGKFTRFRNLSTSKLPRFRNGKCSELNLNFGRFAVDFLSGMLDGFIVEGIPELAQSGYNIHITEEEVEAVVDCSSPIGGRGEVVESVGHMQNRDGFDSYPTRSELYEAVKEFGSNLSNEDSFTNHVLSELKESGMVKHAFDGKKHVYYSSRQPDPDGAYWVRTDGEKYEP